MIFPIATIALWHIHFVGVSLFINFNFYPFFNIARITVNYSWPIKFTIKTLSLIFISFCFILASTVFYNDAHSYLCPVVFYFIKTNPFTPITISMAKVPKTAKYPTAFVFRFIIRLHLHKTKNSIVSTAAAIIYLSVPNIDAILASSCKSIPPKTIEKNLENIAKNVNEYA